MNPTRSIAFGLVHRLYKVRLVAALIACLPLVVFIGWYTWSAFASFDRYRRASGSELHFDFEMFQLSLHDELMRDLRRLMLPERPAVSPLPTFSLSLTREALDELRKDSKREGSDSYSKGYLEKDGRIFEVRMRYRGQSYWYWLYPQKSFKVRLDKGELVEGARTFHLINDVTPFGLEQQIILDLAREHGLLTPEYQAVWVRLNNSDLGVYRYEAHPDEGLLRRNHRMPGSMYSGNTEAVHRERGVGALFYDRADWRKVASRSEEAETDFSELDRLLAAVQGASSSDFASYTERELDLDKFALFDALDVVFGGDQHDYFDNHKLYFDPYRGKFEPITWSFRGFEHEETFNRVENPLILRLKFVPGYLARRNRMVYRLVTGEASVSAVHARADAAFEALAPDLRADGYWDAYKLLAPATEAHRRMVRPMSNGQWLLASRLALSVFERRSAYLVGMLERPAIKVSWREATGKKDLRSGQSAIDVSVDGHASYALRSTLITGRCSGSFSIWADRNRDGVFTKRDDTLVGEGSFGEDAEITAYRDLHPGVELIPRADPKPSRGKVLARPSPRHYRYFVLAPECPPEKLSLVFENQITGLAYRPSVTLSFAANEASANSLPGSHDIPDFVAGEQSPHAWDFPNTPAPVEVALGPGEVQVNGSRTFGKHERVRIAPGTTLKLGGAASLSFYGQLLAEGTSSAPIFIEPASGQARFGTIALQGPGTAGSRLVHLYVRGGSKMKSSAVDYPGMLNIHDTSDITLEDVELKDCAACEDVLHTTYVTQLKLTDVRVEGAPLDAIDLEFSTAELQAIRVNDAADDCLDLMGTKLRVADSVLAGCTNNGISAGEETELTTHGIIIAGARVGVLSKNASTVRLSRSLIYDCDVALKTGRKEKHYEGESSIGGSGLLVERCKKFGSPASGTRLAARAMAAGTGDALEHLFGLLQIQRWEQLDSALLAPQARRQ